MVRVVADLRRPYFALALSGAVIVLVTVILIAVDPGNGPERVLGPRHVIFAYVFPVAIVSIVSGSVAALSAAVASALCAVYFFYSPSFAFYVADPLDIAELGFFLLFVSLGGHAMARILRGARSSPRTGDENRGLESCQASRRATGAA